MDPLITDHSMHYFILGDFNSEFISRIIQTEMYCTSFRRRIRHTKNRAIRRNCLLHKILDSLQQRKQQTLLNTFGNGAAQQEVGLTSVLYRKVIR